MKASELISQIRKIVHDNDLFSRTVPVSDLFSDVRDLIGDAFEPYRWSNEKLLAFTNDGIATIVRNRTDIPAECAVPVELNGDLPFSDKFKKTMEAYVAYRAFENEMDDQTDTGRAALYQKQFSESLAGVPYHWTDDEILHFLNIGIVKILGLRPEERLTDNMRFRSDDSFEVATADSELTIGKHLWKGLSYYTASRLMERSDMKAATEMIALFYREIVGDVNK